MIRDFVNGAGRVAGSIAIACVGILVWVFIGFAWFCACVWNQRRKVAEWAPALVAGIAASVCGYAGTVFSLQFIFVMGDWIARSPSAAMASRWMRW